MKNISALLLHLAFYCIPFLMWDFTVNQTIDFAIGCTIVTYSIANGLLFFALSLLFLFLNKKNSIIYSTVFFIAGYTIAIGLIVSKFILHLRFSPLILNALFDTTAAEASEYFFSRLSFSSATLFIFFIAILIFGYLLFLKSLNSLVVFSKRKRLHVILAIAVFYGGCIYSNDLLYSNNAFNEIFSIYKSYTIQKDFLKKNNYAYLNKNQCPNCYALDNNGKTIILVIGESHARFHMSLYGYGRETNPLLGSIKNNLHIFSNVISPATTTISSLQKMLSFATIKDIQPLFSEPTLLDIFNSLGYKTWWLSNQQISGIHDTWSKLYGEKALTHIFINSTNNWHNYSFDENLFPYYDNALKDTAAKKLIIVHLMGSHERADKRYSSKFNLFTTTTFPKSANNLNTHQKNYINYYDNSIAYNDYILYTLISKTQKLKEKVCLVYVADHGEEVCEETDFYGHNEGVTSKYMCEIPFFIYSSNNYLNETQKTTLHYNIDKAFQTDNLLHGILDLANLRTKMYDSTKSIFNTRFTPSKRYINGLDYDSLYRKKL